MGQSATDMLSLSRWARALALASVGGMLLGVLGPFGSYLNGGFFIRILYWVACMWSGLALYGAGVMASAKLCAASRRAFWAVLVVSVLIASLPQAVLTRAFAFRLWPELVGLRLSFGTWYAQVVTVGLLAVLGSAVAMQLLSGRRSTAQSSPASSPVGRPCVSFSGDVIALQMEDHYVRIHRQSGSELVLMPLGRAIDAVSAVEGLRTHRSWWVARHAVARVDGSTRSMNLHLTNGMVAPVSRNAVANLRAAGWLEPSRSELAA